MPFFTVILPTFNRLPMLQEAIKSVQQQSFQDYELIVVDDGSTDGTADYLLTLSKKVNVISTANAGPGAARNAALVQAKGTWIAFLDSDDAWFPWTLSTYHSVTEAAEGGVFFTGTALPWEQRHEATATTTQCNTHDKLLDAAQGEMPPLSGTPSICIRADILRQSGGFAAIPINAEDVDLWLRLGCVSQFVQIQQPPVFAQRKHQGNVTDHLQSGIAGAEYLIHQERSGAYPGGKAYATQRQRIIAANARSIILCALRAGDTSSAWSLFRQTLDWQLHLHRWRFLAAVPVLMLWSKAQGAGKQTQDG